MMREALHENAVSQAAPPGIEEGQPAAPAVRERLLAAGGLIGAVAGSSCCIVPLVLVTLGIGGAWTSSLTALEPYKPYDLTATALILGAGFWHVYIRPRKACADGSSCRRPAPKGVTKFSLWLATGVVLAAATVNLWAPLLY